MRLSAEISIESAVSKVPEVTLGFWVIKIACTTLGETGGDWVTMSLDLGYLVGSLIFLVGFVLLVSAQIRTCRLYSPLYWATIIATTTLGTTLADFCDRSLGVGYPGGVSIIAALLAASLAVWYGVEGAVSAGSVVSARAQWFYWITILFSQTLGTALGDWVAGDDRGGLGLGYGAGTLIFGCGLVVVALFALWPRVSRTALFWAAFVLTRPLGATLGDWLDKPVVQGGLQFSRFYASALLIAFVAGCILLIPQRAARRSN